MLASCAGLPDVQSSTARGWAPCLFKETACFVQGGKITQWPRRASDLQVSKPGMTLKCGKMLCAHAALRPLCCKQVVSASNAWPAGRCCGTSAIAWPAGEQAGHGAGRQAAPCRGVSFVETSVAQICCHGCMSMGDSCQCMGDHQHVGM